MLQQISPGCKLFFLRQFTIELIKQTEIKRKSKLNERINEQLKQPAKVQDLKSELKKPLTPMTIIRKPIQIKKPKIQLLKIPEPRLPTRLQYLRPTPTEKEIDLDKLNPLIKDPAVKTIECHGPGENIIVKGTMGAKPTSITLNKDEIDQVLNKFSEVAKIPIQEGIFKVAFGKLTLSAITSKVIGSKFIINKMSYTQAYHPIQNVQQ